MKVRILDLSPNDEVRIHRVAELLFEGFQENCPDAWPDRVSALQEVRDSFGSDRFSRIAIDSRGEIVGWIGGIRQYDGNVWELHPLVVKAEFRRRGIGRVLVADLEEQVRKQGALTLWVGTDDENNLTTLSGKDLYADVWEQIANIGNLRDHPYEFYQKLGFVIIGVMPDANGSGKPDIYMAKPIDRNTEIDGFRE
ncbi:GNAT family N-acetyltransferase [Oscillatoriales cyanobacterium LEGE 11467]|uniref:GNAT family N-acetyltransferase n=1 Tax=Zarconia navalis LEGE 11467 TaxID=1828826 RepID=A0A928Z9V8_9CYAN|nr:GNAT family N-acetyltransferase [Zarconia navalis]MBE9041141.1 GNAT family N-acetyltransferase [Zarconia navalis LEGE 11467]